MLLKYGAKNFFCFNEAIEISFELSSNCPKDISKGKSFSNAICVNGANGSGKTNALKILSFLKWFCCDSFLNKPDDEIHIVSFFNNNNVTEVFIEFQLDTIKYRYEVILNKTQILFEILYKKNLRYTKIVERKNNTIINCIKEYSEINKIAKIRSNASIISTSNQYEIKLIQPIYNFFNSILTNISYLGLLEIVPDYNKIAEYYYNNSIDFSFVKKIMIKCDLGINNIVIQKSNDKNGDVFYYPVFHHNVENKNKYLSLYFQSSGTKFLFYNLLHYKYVLDSGGILVLDEFDLHLHPAILPILLNLFIDGNHNPKNAQIIFTTHNSSIMDLLGKYRTILINKEENESYGYRLDEIPGDIIRNDRLISPIYKAGKIGGIPKV